MDFKIAIVQKKVESNNLQSNTDKGIECVKKAKQMGADIVLFPECWINGYDFPDIDEKQPLEILKNDPLYREWCSRALDENSKYIQEFCNIAQKLNIGVVTTCFTQGESKPQNTAFVIDKNGNIIMKYSKVHTCDFSCERLLESGNEFKVCDFHGVKLGIMICYDREYPESARILMLKGAELILVPNDCGEMPARVQALSTRAYENMTGVIMANPPGENAGCSCAYSPITWDKHGIPINNTIVLADSMTDDIFIAEYNMDELRDYRNNEMMGNTFRKVKAYTELLNKEINKPFIRE
ncbi:carbon-nitrogen hydrolase family protein [Clostridium sp.]|uniref:carbon-nitrogen hydrolase family protein n=1 Tax=Clostridium sp. TaxID=1506 RepID=UPI003216C245